MEALGLRKNILIGTICASLLAVAYGEFSKHKPGANPLSEANLSSETYPVVSVYPIQMAGSSDDGGLRALGLGTEALWNTWLGLSPSVIWVSHSNSEILGLDARPPLRKVARALGANFLFTGTLQMQEGQVWIQPILYDREEDLVLKTKPHRIFEEGISESIQGALVDLLGLAERSYRNRGRKYRFSLAELGNATEENFHPSSENLRVYLSLLDKRTRGQSVALEDWDAIAKRENFFWNPLDVYIEERFRGKEESYDTRYYLETMAKRQSGYFHYFLAKHALRFADNLIVKGSRYPVPGFLDLAGELLVSSRKTLSVDYAHYLHLRGEFSLLEKDEPKARLSILNSQEILKRLGQEHNPLYLKNKFRLSQLYKTGGQTQLSLMELEEALHINESDWKLYPADHWFFLAQAHFNLGTLNLELGRLDFAKIHLTKAMRLLQENNSINTELMLQVRLNLSVCYLMLGDRNGFLHWAMLYDNDLKILNLERSDFDSKNSYNLALAYLQKGGGESAKFHSDRYTRMTPFSKLRSLQLESRPEAFPVRFEYQKPTGGTLTDWEAGIVKSFTGKYRAEAQTQDIRSRTYTHRLDDHELFLAQLFGVMETRSPEMAELQKLLRIRRNHSNGDGVVFTDIGPALGNATQPAVTSLSLLERFPKMDMVLLELPEEVEYFYTKTDEGARKKILANDRIHILAGDGTQPISEILRRESAKKTSHPLPKFKNQLHIIRAANSIDIYEPFTKVMPYLESLGRDYFAEDVLVFFNRSVFWKPRGSGRLILIGLQSNRGYYHNTQSLDRQGEPPFVLSSLALTRSVP